MSIPQVKRKALFRWRYRLEETPVGIVPVFHVVAVAQRGQKPFKRWIIRGWNLKSSQHTSEVRSMVTVVKEADIPPSAKGVKKLE